VPHLPEVKPADHKNIPMMRERCGKYGWFGSKAIEGWGCSRRMVRAKAVDHHFVLSKKVLNLEHLRFDTLSSHPLEF
jgi:hypothetical protein